MSTDQKQRPLVAVGIIFERDGKILINERILSHGSGTYQILGGHLGFGKTFEEQALAEVAEETGLTDIEFIKPVSLDNERVYRKHYVGSIDAWRSGIFFNEITS